MSIATVNPARKSPRSHPVLYLGNQDKIGAAFFARSAIISNTISEFIMVLIAPFRYQISTTQLEIEAFTELHMY